FAIPRSANRDRVHGHHNSPRRKKLNQIRYLGILVLLGILGMLLANPFSVGAAGTTYASDSFSRTQADSWGNAETGGAYALSGAVADFDVNGSVGTLNTPAG